MIKKLINYFRESRWQREIRKEHKRLTKAVKKCKLCSPMGLCKKHLEDQVKLTQFTNDCHNMIGMGDSGEL